jgi:hypothetical protein
MKMCVKHYLAQIPQLDLSKSQGGVKIEDALSHDGLGLPRSKREKQKKQGTLEQQLRNQSKEPRKRMTSVPNYAETLEKFRARNNDGLGKGRETKGLLSKPKEDLKLLNKQIKSQPALWEEQLNHQQKLKQVPRDSNTARQGSEGQTTTSSTLPNKTTIVSDIGIELLQVLKNTTAFSIAGKFGKKYALLKENPDSQTFRAFKHALTTQWDVLPQDQRMIKEYYEVKESQKVSLQAL